MAEKEYIPAPVSSVQFYYSTIKSIENEDNVDKKIILEDDTEVQPTDFYDYKVGDKVFVFSGSATKAKLPIWYKNEFDGTPRVIPVKISNYGLGS